MWQFVYSSNGGLLLFNGVMHIPLLSKMFNAVVTVNCRACHAITFGVFINPSMSNLVLAYANTASFTRSLHCTEQVGRIGQGYTCIGHLWIVRLFLCYWRSFLAAVKISRATNNYVMLLQHGLSYNVYVQANKLKASHRPTASICLHVTKYFYAYKGIWWDVWVHVIHTTGSHVVHLQQLVAIGYWPC